MDINVVILAAGKGTRMRSQLPKVLHPIAAKPMVQHVIDTARELNATALSVVFGHGGDLLRNAIGSDAINWVEQAEQLGTGHAVAQALSHVKHDELVLILYGDVPLTRSETLKGLIDAASSSGFAVLTAILDDATGYGRIVRNDVGKLTRIVEQKDADESELAIQEINTGIMAVKGEYLHRWLPTLGNDNAQGEYYLTDCVALAVAEGIEVASSVAVDVNEVSGVNNRIQLAELERIYQRAQAERLMLDGATLADPERVDVRGEITIGEDVFIDINVVFEGNVTLADGVHIGPNCVVKDAEIGAGTQVNPNCVIDSAKIGAQAKIGPFARVRPDTDLGDRVHVGNFVEIKKATIAEGSKANHLAYIGDSEIGRNVNVGAGTITCNYDGANKHKTVLEDDVFVGSDTQLVAPVTVGRGTTIAAGTTVTHDVAAETLVISRVKQKEISGWKRPVKKKK